MQALELAIKDLLHKPLSTLMTVLVIACAFFLPLVLSVAVNNAQHVVNKWQETVQVSLFLKKSSSREQQRETLSRVRGHQSVLYANLISPKAGLIALEEQTGMTDVSSLLQTNPLPAVIEVHPKVHDSVAIKKLLQDFRGLPSVAVLKFDMAWLERLMALTQFVWKLERALGLFFAFAVFFVVVNTIRLIIFHKRSEIEVLSLIGATSSYIRRPFLYSGALYGLLGGLLSLLLMSFFMTWLGFQAEELSSLYHQQVHLELLNLPTMLGFMFVSMCLGILGARVSLYRQCHL